MKRILITALAFHLFAIGYCQNLVINPSFEDTVSCPNNFGQVNQAIGWFNGLFSPDYFNACTSNLNVDVPTNYYGYAFPADGNAYVGLATYISNNPNYREIIGSSLNQSLVLGTKYYISACIIRVDTTVADCAVDKFGFKFSTTNIAYTNLVNNFSHFNSDTIYLDKTNWTTISGSFIADSSYQFIYIGNFYKDANINPTQCSINSSFHVGYNLIDNICVSSDSLSCIFDCNANVGLYDDFLTNSVNVFPNPCSDKINIETSENNLLSFSLFDLTSKPVLTQEFISSTEVDINNLPKGIYIYKMYDKHNFIKVGKIVKY